MNCIVCGKENNLSKSKFCSNKCKQHYYYEQRKEELKETRKKHYQENKDSYATNHKKWRENNREKFNEYHREYGKRKRRERQDNEQ